MRSFSLSLIFVTLFFAATFGQTITLSPTTIKGDKPHSSGLIFKNLNNSSPAAPYTGRFLSVDSAGVVILSAFLPSTSAPIDTSLNYLPYLLSPNSFSTINTDLIYYDGSPWYRKSGLVTSSTPGYGGVLFPGPTGYYYQRQTDHVTARMFGALGDGSTNDNAAITKALSSTYTTIILENGVYMADEVTVPTGKKLVIEATATIKQRGYSNSASKALIHLLDNAVLAGDGFVDGNGSALSSARSSLYTQNAGISVDGNNVTVDGITVKNTITHSLIANQRTNLSLLNYTDLGVARGALILRCDGVTVRNYTHRDSRMVYRAVFQHCLDFLYSKHIDVDGAKFLNVSDSTTAASKLISGITLLGNQDSKFNDLTFSGNLSPYHDGLPIPDDGSVNCVFSNIVITNWKSTGGLEVAGSKYCTYSNILIDNTTLSNTTGGSQGVYLFDISTNGGILSPLTGEVQSRDRAVASDNKFENINVLGGFAGFRVAGARNTFINCTATGQTYGWRIQQLQGGPGTKFWKRNVLQRVNDNLFIDCGVANCVNGFTFWGGQDNKFIRPRVTNSTYGFNNATPLSATLVSATTTTITLPTSQSANVWKNFLVFITSGTGVGQTRTITSHTTTVYTVDNAWTVTPDTTSEVVIIDNPSGSIYIDSPTITDNQAFTLAGAASFPVLSSSPTSLTAITVAVGAERFSYNQKFILKNIISGASSPDLLVQVTAIDKTTTDRLYITPISLGNGSAVMGTLAPTLVTGTGTLTSSNINVNSGAAQIAQIIGSGTKLPDEIDAHYWIKINNEWLQVLQGVEDTMYVDTKYWLTTPITTPGSGQSFQISKVDIVGIPQLVSGINFNRYPSDVVLTGDVRITGNSGAAISSFRSPSVNSLALTTNSATPTIAAGTFFKTTNTTTTTITNFLGGLPGKHIIINVSDANTIFGFVTSNLKGYSSNYAASNGDVITAIYNGTNWLCTIRPVAGKFKTVDFGDASNTVPSLKVAGGASGTDIVRLSRSTGVTSAIGLGINSTGLTVRDSASNAYLLNVGLSGTARKITLGADKTSAALAGQIYAESVIGGALTDSPGAGLLIASGKGTGAAASPSVVFATPDPGTTGTAQQSLTTKVEFVGRGAVLIGGIADNVVLADKLLVAGNINLTTAGNKLKIATGTNASAGTTTLVAGTVTVNTTAITSSSIVSITVQETGNYNGRVRVSARTAGTSFTITSSDSTDTASIGWLIIN